MASFDLRFGDMDFSPQAQTGDVEYAVYGFQRGSLVPVTVVAESMMRDGADEYVGRWENRGDLRLLVGMRGSDTGALADAEETLWRECQKRRNELVFTPNDGYGAPTAFDVLWTGLRFRDDTADWDLDEVLRGWRVWELTPRTLPFPRSTTEVVDEALTSSSTPSTVTIADGTSATGWTSPDGAITSSGGVMVVPAVFTGSIYDGTGWRFDHFTWRAERTLSATDFTATPYLSFDTVPEPSGGSRYAASASAFVDGSEVALLSSSSVGGPARHSFLVNDASATALSLRGTVAVAIYQLGNPAPTPVPTVTVDLDNVQRSNMAPTASTTGRQSVRTIEVRGSARTEGRLQVAHETAGLGDVLVYTGPEGGAVPLRQWRTSGATETTDSTTVTGRRQSLSTAAVFDVPTSGLPRGGYLLYLRARAEGGGSGAFSVAASATTRIGSTDLGSQSTTSDAVSAPAWKIFPVGDFTLPVTDVPEGSIATARITIGPVVGIEFDEAWLFYAGEGASLSQVACGIGTPAAGTVHNRLWLDTASLVRPEPAVWVGTQPDRSDALFADAAGGVASWGTHSFPAGNLWAFLVTTGASYAGLLLGHYPRAHTHARHYT